MRRMFLRKKSPHEKAKELAESIVNLARTVAPAFYQQLYVGECNPSAERESQQTASLAMELIYISLHLVDREYFARHGADARDKFMDVLLVETWTPLLDAMPENARSAAGRVIVEQANQVQLEFAQYPQLAPEKGLPLGGTLFWEFSKRLVRVYNPQNVGAVILLNLVCIDYVRSLYQLMDAVKIRRK
jgi:hypothetical protein